MTMAVSSPVLMAFQDYLNAFNKALFDHAYPYGSPAAFNLVESHEALAGFMIALVDPLGFRNPYDITPEDHLLREYGAFSGRPYNRSMVIDFAWLARMVDVARQFPSESALLEKQVTATLYSKVEELCTNTGLVQTFDATPLTTSRLRDAVTQCLQVAIEWRLREANISPDFPRLAVQTAGSILLYTIQARLIQHPLLKELLPLERLLRAGILPVGRKEELDGAQTVHGIRIYKIPGELSSPVSRHTVAIQAPIVRSEPPVSFERVKETRAGIGPQVSFHTPRVLLMSRIQEIAHAYQLNQPLLNEPFRVWSGFMKTHIESPQGFLFGHVSDDLLPTVRAVTSLPLEALHAYGFNSHDLYYLAKRLEDQQQEYAEGKAKYQRNARATIRSPFGRSIWMDPYFEEQVYLAQAEGRHPTPVTTCRQELRAALDMYLRPSLDRSFETSGVMHAPLRNLLCNVVQGTFFRLFDAAFQGDTQTLTLLMRLIEFMRRGMIPMGSQLDQHDRPTLYVVASG